MRTHNKGCIKQLLVEWRDFQILGKCHRTDENITDHLYEPLASDSLGYYFAAKKVADFGTKLATQFEMDHDRWEVGLVDISYPKE